MGRKEVEELLEKNPDKWFTIQEISDSTGLSYSTILRTVRQNTGFTLIQKHDGVRTWIKIKNDGDLEGYNSTPYISHNVYYAKKREGKK